jgi:hypothetical protein
LLHGDKGTFAVLVGGLLITKYIYPSEICDRMRALQ